MTEPLQVAVAVILRGNQVLISKRSASVDQPDMWEFPGGKIEQGETDSGALIRELKEELGIDVMQYHYLFAVNYDYSGKQVCLQVYIVSEYSGREQSLENQPLQWSAIDKLSSLRFPAANKVIIKAISLPDMIQITGQFTSLSDLLRRAELCLKNGVRMIQFRAHQLNDEDFLVHAKALLELCKRYNAKLIINRALEVALKVKAHGVHLNRHQLMKYKKRPELYDRLLSASCHNQTELKQAEVLNVDFCFLSPVKQARSHNAGIALGFSQFAALTAGCTLPVYALGGMLPSDLLRVKTAGGIGIAAICGHWQ
ncbi:MAG: Nudix family hydrolase [Gammaproteobacteria bacterium]|nr:Nudix family hydrolase [Gammaproteobacteria bacterium]